MIGKKVKSAVPVYGVAVVWALYCLAFPLYKTWHFIVLACAAALVNVVLSAIFPGRTEYTEVPAKPVLTGDEKVDALLLEGEKAVSEMHRLLETIPGQSIKRKITEIIDVTDKIFKDLLEDHGDYKQIRRFADFHLPTTIKLLHTYDRFGKSGVRGENIAGTMTRIDTALDTILESYKKFFDSLYANQALDIETDITVLETMLKNDRLI